METHALLSTHESACGLAKGTFSWSENELPTCATCLELFSAQEVEIALMKGPVTHGTNSWRRPIKTWCGREDSRAMCARPEDRDKVTCPLCLLMTMEYVWEAAKQP